MPWRCKKAARHKWILCCGVGGHPWPCWSSWGTVCVPWSLFFPGENARWWMDIEILQWYGTIHGFGFVIMQQIILKLYRAKRFPQLEGLLGKLTKCNVSSMNRFQLTGRIHFRMQEEAFPLISGNFIAGCKWRKNIAKFVQKVLSAFWIEFATANVFSPLNLAVMVGLLGHAAHTESRWNKNKKSLLSLLWEVQLATIFPSGRTLEPTVSNKCKLCC